ncbi:MAG TPA: amidase [Solirubrobacteraceae bacterium]|nr:amidase [Solirubrobacteraceae bacterium]
MTAVAAPPRVLTERSALELAAAIRAGEVSSREVVEAHVERLEREAHRNAVVIERFAAARKEADAADARIAGTGDSEDLPPFLGVPCTVKEAIALHDLPNCAGLVRRREHRASTTAPVAQRLLDAGAIPLGLTNTPELCLHIESSNLVYGRTANAYDASRTAGGSSGGEGSAIGCGGSPFGLGSDIGGSIRLPAYFNGIFGHKPSPGVTPSTGHFPLSPGPSGEMFIIGPLARRAEDLMPVLKAIAGPDPDDPWSRDVTLGDPAAVDLSSVEVIVSEEASLLPVRSELREARERAAEALGALGAPVRRESMRSVRRATELFLAALQDGSGVSTGELLADGSRAGVTLRAALRAREHTLPVLVLLAAEAAIERIPRAITRRLLASGRALLREVSTMIGDGILLHPPFPRLAPRHGATLAQPWLLAPTAVFSLLRLPVTQVPTGLSARGLPLGVQVVAGRDRAHMTIAAALELERALGGWSPPAAT